MPFSKKRCDLGHQPCPVYKLLNKRKKKNKNKQEQKNIFRLKSQHAFEKKKLPSFSLKKIFTDHNQFLKNNVYAPEG